MSFDDDDRRHAVKVLRECDDVHHIIRGLGGAIACEMCFSIAGCELVIRGRGSEEVLRARDCLAELIDMPKGPGRIEIELNQDELRKLMVNLADDGIPNGKVGPCEKENLSRGQVEKLKEIGFLPEDFDIGDDGE